MEKIVSALRLDRRTATDASCTVNLAIASTTTYTTADASTGGRRDFGRLGLVTVCNATGSAPGTVYDSLRH